MKKLLPIGLFIFACFLLTSCDATKKSKTQDYKEVIVGDADNEVVYTMTLIDRLRRLPGVTVDGNSSNAIVRIRGGSTSLIGSHEPLFVVGNQVIDGGFQSVHNLVPPESIKSVRVLKSSTELSLYGSRGTNGVIKITLKSRN